MSYKFNTCLDKCKNMKRKTKILKNGYNLVHTELNQLSMVHSNQRLVTLFTYKAFCWIYHRLPARTLKKLTKNSAVDKKTCEECEKCGQLACELRFLFV